MEARELCLDPEWRFYYRSLNNQMFRILVSFIFLPFLRDPNRAQGYSRDLVNNPISSFL